MFSPADLSNRLVLAIPKKGRLYEKSLQLLAGADIQFYRKNRLDIALSTNLDVALVFLPASDIPKFVSDGTVDLGITGQDVVKEARADVDEVLALGFGQCDLCIQVPEASGITDPKHLVGKRIVTSFENIAGEYFAELDKQQAATKETTVSFVSGSVEAACALGLADAIVDLVESGETMRAAGLQRIHTLVSSQAVLIANKRRLHPELAAKITSRIRGVILAGKYVYCNYNVPRSKIDEAFKVTPGRKAPTVAPLENGDWVAVSVMVKKSEVAEKMDRLEELGATDILVFSISNCRE
ncbi:ATP phosphoribosyltransferase [Catenaria anguillulae PL171]|uniref:ATP phosphoribosyltransferase n=1 Tax=Catenaria anguillulae PL171 TaxID=765915 RepID=A0A1Y2I3L9_9FUNG|nr:ATP phosphoribosyltransferase [Catenaria anguillulae PL171]